LGLGAEDALLAAAAFHGNIAASSMAIFIHDMQNQPAAQKEKRPFARKKRVLKTMVQMIGEGSFAVKLETGVSFRGDGCGIRAMGDGRRMRDWFLEWCENSDNSGSRCGPSDTVFVSATALIQKNGLPTLITRCQK
jgi:hypothetical protein